MEMLLLALKPTVFVYSATSATIRPLRPCHEAAEWPPATGVEYRKLVGPEVGERMNSGRTVVKQTKV